MCTSNVVNYVKQKLAGLGISASSQGRPLALRPGGFSTVQDLTHVLSPNFPVYGGKSPAIKITTAGTVQSHVFYANYWELHEHTGTHMDAPAHRVETGLTADQILPENLVAPLAVISLQDKANKDEDAQLMVEDVWRWEKRYGRVPTGALVAMYSGWEARLTEPKRFVNLDTSGVQHFPSFHHEAAAFLVREREVKGIGVDTLSIDFGPSQDFQTHVLVLGAGRYGLENLANLAKVPPAGATIFVGGPKVQGASGGPVRALAVW